VTPGPPPGVRVWLAAGATDMRRGFDGLARQVQEALGQDPFSGQLFVFRGRRGDLVKALWWDGQGLDPPRLSWTGYATFAACRSAWSGVR
jgi:transposase